MNTVSRGWPAFQRLWVATASANLADGFLLAAVPLIALSLTRDPLVITGLTVVQYIPWLFFSFPAGVLADLRDRTKLMRLANIVRVLVLTSLAIAALLGLLSLPVLFVGVFIMGVAETLYDNTSSAVVPSIVADDQLERANGRLQATYTLANSFIGPPLGGVLAGFAVAAPLFLGAAGYILALVLLLFVPSVRAVGSDEIGAAERGFVGPMRDGWKVFHQSRPLVALCILAAVGNAVSASAYSLVPLFVVDTLKAPASTYGLVLAGGAIGALLGGALGDRVASRVPSGVMLLGTTIASGATLAVLALAAHPIVVSALMAIDGFLIMAQSVVLVSARARLIPDAAMGRVTAVFRSFSLGASVIGAFAGGLAARFASIDVVFVVGGLVLALLAIFLMRPLGTARLQAAIKEVSARPATSATHMEAM